MDYLLPSIHFRSPVCWKNVRRDQSKMVNTDSKDINLLWADGRVSQTRQKLWRALPFSRPCDSKCGASGLIPAGWEVTLSLMVAVFPCVFIQFPVDLWPHKQSEVQQKRSADFSVCAFTFFSFFFITAEPLQPVMTKTPGVQKRSRQSRRRSVAEFILSFGFLSLDFEDLFDDDDVQGRLELRRIDGRSSPRSTPHLPPPGAAGRPFTV